MFEKDAFQPNAFQVGGEKKKDASAFQTDAFQPSHQVGRVAVTGGSVDHPATIDVTLDGITVSISGAVGHPATVAVTLDGIAVSAAGTVGHPGAVAVTLDGISADLNGATGHPATIAVTLDTLAVSADGAVGHPATIAVTLDDVTALLDGVTGRVASIDATLEGITVDLAGEFAPGGAAHPIGGADFWLRRIEEEPQKVRKIIKRVAKEEAEKSKPFKMAPIREAFQAIAYPFKSDYYELYRQAYKAELARLRQEAEDDDEEVLMLM